MNKQNVIPRQAQQKNWHLSRYAIHKAGHAVVGHVIRRRVSDISIITHKAHGYPGYCPFSVYAEDLQGLTQWRDSS